MADLTTLNFGWTIPAENSNSWFIVTQSFFRGVDDSTFLVDSMLNAVIGSVTARVNTTTITVPYQTTTTVISWIAPAGQIGSFVAGTTYVTPSFGTIGPAAGGFSVNASGTTVAFFLSGAGAITPAPSVIGCAGTVHLRLRIDANNALTVGQSAWRFTPGLRFANFPMATLGVLSLGIGVHSAELQVAFTNSPVSSAFRIDEHNKFGLTILEDPT